ncbi:MAG TPA: bifunctional DNA primase/polymerase, partial [Chloroflexota bacterium]
MSNSTSSKRPGCLDAAIDYAKRGFSVILLHGITNGLCTCGKPGCPSPGKHPIGKSWKRAQTERATPEELEAEFVRHPDANIGIVTGLVSGLVVADLDGEPGMSSLMSLLVGQEPP